ncbi:MAG: T9SS type A sorting domain-containing protein, partial [Bacteroidetes bacterium]|nr:T9SS type A sorting domain-containing protein [Bacteroidota bacterium]
TMINYTLYKNSHVKLSIYNILGQVVKELVSQRQTSGRYSVQFNASNLPSGVYIYKLQVGEFYAAKKMILLR